MVSIIWGRNLPASDVSGILHWPGSETYEEDGRILWIGQEDSGSLQENRERESSWYFKCKFFRVQVWKVDSILRNNFLIEDLFVYVVSPILWLFSLQFIIVRMSWKVQCMFWGFSYMLIYISYFTIFVRSSHKILRCNKIFDMWPWINHQPWSTLLILR